MSVPVVSIEKDGATWVVRVTGPDGRVQTFGCATEKMAHQLAKAFERSGGRPSPR